MCSLFSSSLDASTVKSLGINAKSFGETEKLCVSRLLALSRIRSYSNGDTDEGDFVDVEKILFSQFGYEINLELVQIYMSFEFGRFWTDLKERGKYFSITDQIGYRDV
jgi:hypothetical protein